MLKPVVGLNLMSSKKSTSRLHEGPNNEHSDVENFSQLIGFNERKDHNELQLNDLETFINFQYKKKGAIENNANETSSDDDLSHMFRKSERLPAINKALKKRKKVVKGNSAHTMDRKTGGPVLATAASNFNS